MSNNRINQAQIEAILASDQEAVNRFLVTAVAELLAIHEGRPAVNAASRSRRWLQRRTLIIWTLGVIVAGFSIVSMIMTLVGH